MRQKQKQKIKQVGMIILLVLITLGFTVPGFLHSQNADSYQGNVQTDSRLCQSDTDCYLMCDDIPQEVLCTQNLCLRNSCDEISLYPKLSTPVSFQLSVEVNSQELDLQNRYNQNNFLVSFANGFVNVHKSGLSLRHIIDKVNLRLTNECLYDGGASYCSDAEYVVELFVNNEKSFVYENYKPKEGDVVKIAYGERS